MAIKKSELYSSLWASCDELRGGMDASQYKDYVLVLLFIKYISDKYAGVPYAPITVPEGAAFSDMVALKGKPTIGDDINKLIIEKIARANNLTGTIDVADFNSADKLGSGKEMVSKLTNLISIFENPALDFTQNRAENDDILGDAYEYLMKHFATESGKSKGQFYTPSEVSRIMAKIIGVNKENTSAETTAYDPTCGSGSLLLKVASESEREISLYGQENDTATSGLARMNMILHNCPTAEIKQGNTLANPLWLDNNGKLKTFDYAVANPPFSYKSWTNGFAVQNGTTNDIHERFTGFGVPPTKNGDYAFLLHLIKSLKSKGKAAVILPHGVLFRGNTEAEIRKNIILKSYIKGIIGLPANLFYGTGIPACIIVIDKEKAEHRKAIFMIDASKGFIKDGNKNRLREQDIHKIVDVFNRQTEIPKYSRVVPLTEIEANDYNLNIPRYIDSQEAEDIQDIQAHLSGGIPNIDIEALDNYWKVYPSLKSALFQPNNRANYSELKTEIPELKQSIFRHPEFVKFSRELDAVFNDWKSRNTKLLKALTAGFKPKLIIQTISEDILQTYNKRNLIDKYDVYQQLMNYWNDIMQDDCYIIASDDWKAELKYDEKKKLYDCDLIPKYLITDRYFTTEKQAMATFVEEKEQITGQLQELEDEHGVEDGLLDDARNDKDKITASSVKDRLKKINAKAEFADEQQLLEEYIKLTDKQTALNKKIKDATTELDKKIIAKYKVLTEDEIKVLVVDDKWMTSIERDIKSEMDNISHKLTQRIKELAERYETPMPEQTKEVQELEDKVNNHLQKMGFVW